MPKLNITKERIKVNFRHIMNFYRGEIASYGVWWTWNIPFQIISVCISIASYFYFSKLFAARNPIYLKYGDPISFIIIGLAVNTFLHVSLTAYYEAISALYGGRMGFGGLRMSRIDYFYLAKISPYTFIIARVSLKYITHTILTLLYIFTGILIFGLKINPQANLHLALTFMALGTLACSGIGLISASMYWLLGTYRGTEPIRWLITLLVPLVSGIYYPIDVLPQELKILSLFLPHTYVVRGVRGALLYGITTSEAIQDLLRLSLFTLSIPIGIVALRLSFYIARRRGVIY